MAKKETLSERTRLAPSTKKTLESLRLVPKEDLDSVIQRLLKKLGIKKVS